MSKKEKENWKKKGVHILSQSPQSWSLQFWNIHHALLPGKSFLLAGAFFLEAVGSQVPHGC